MSLKKLLKKFFESDISREQLEALSTDDLIRLTREFPNSPRNKVILDILAQRDRSYRAEFAKKIGHLAGILHNIVASGYNE